MLLGRKRISPGDDRKTTVTYEDWMESTETLSNVVFAADAGPATIPSFVIAGDGKSVAFFLTGAVIGTPVFNVTIVATTSSGQIKNDHIEFNVVPS